MQTSKCPGDNGNGHGIGGCFKDGGGVSCSVDQVSTGGSAYGVYLYVVESGISGPVSCQRQSLAAWIVPALSASIASSRGPDSDCSFSLYQTCMHVLCVVCVVPAGSACGSQKREAESQELQLQMLGSHLTGVGT